jgi:hypothetical protein
MAWLLSIPGDIAFAAVVTRTFMGFYDDGRGRRRGGWL